MGQSSAGHRPGGDETDIAAQRTPATPTKNSRGRVPRPTSRLRVLFMGLSTPTDIRRRLLARRESDHHETEVENDVTVDAPADVTVDVTADRAAIAPRSSPTSALTQLDFDAFYRAQYPSVVRLAYSLSGSMPVAEELAQEAFVSAHERWQRIVGFDRPDLWVRRVVINRSISFRRREAIERRAVSRFRPERDEQLEPVVSDELVWRALRELSPRQAEVLALFYVEDQPMAAVAEILGLGPETVKTHLKRGRAALAVKLDEMGHVR